MILNSFQSQNALFCDVISCLARACIFYLKRKRKTLGSHPRSRVVDHKADLGLSDESLAVPPPGPQR